MIVIEHNLDVVARADWVIDLGPGAGHDGGRIVFEGPPADLVRAPSSLTGEHLRCHLAADQPGAAADPRESVLDGGVRFPQNAGTFPEGPSDSRASQGAELPQ